MASSWRTDLCRFAVAGANLFDAFSIIPVPANLRFQPWPKTGTVECLAEIVAAGRRVHFPFEIGVRRSGACRFSARFIGEQFHDHVAAAESAARAFQRAGLCKLP